jgi:hypothetical protein
MGVLLGAFKITLKHLFCRICSCLYVESLTEHQTGTA